MLLLQYLDESHLVRTEVLVVLVSVLPLVLQKPGSRLPA